MIHGTSRTTELDALTTTTEVLKDEPLDWGLGLLARLLVLLSIYLLVVEVRLPASVTGEVEASYVKVEEEQDDEEPPSILYTYF